MIDLPTARRLFAEELRYVAGVRSKRVIDAFASVERERFLGPGPWLIYSANVPDKYWSTEDADPRCVYHNVVIALQPERGLNNGQPSLWAALYDKLDLAPGKRVLHLGCGSGYYSAILAEMVGSTGRVTAVEIDEALASKAREALQPWPQARVICTDGSGYEPGGVDIIVVNAGVTHPLPHWLDALPAGGQLMIPLTCDQSWGRTILITRLPDGERFAARSLGFVGIFHFAGARNAALASRLEAALLRGEDMTVHSLRREAHTEGPSCWLHGDGFCLSRASVDG
jgi:protein-L-isoaspartate(D-aspartate) O-methyltransferase